MDPLPLGAYWGLRRLADDGGRFMWLDLRGADDVTLTELLQALAPFTTGVVIDASTTDTIWRRWGSPQIGRIEAVTTPASLAAARNSGADAVIGPAELADSMAAAGLARIGTDAAAEIGLDCTGRLARIVATTNPAVETLSPDLGGYLVAPGFWRDALKHTADAGARRLIIADGLVPQLQALNAKVADLADARWLDQR